MSGVVLQVPEVHCDDCKTSLETAVAGLDGVTGVTVLIADATMTVRYDDSVVELATIKQVIQERGYAVFG